MMKIYILNLPRFRERLESIKRECARFELEPEFFSCVDVQNLSETEMRELVFDVERNPLCKSEIACFLSHLGIYRDMIEKDIPLALILEDDSVFNLDPRPLLDEMERQPADAPHVYLLTHRGGCYIDDYRLRIGDFKFHQGYDAYGANGYVLTKKAAANLLGFNMPLKCSGDWWRFFQINGLIQFFICEKEIIGLHKELGAPSASLVENDRATTYGPMRKKYDRHLRSQVPFICKVKYCLFKLKNLHKHKKRHK